MPIASPSIPSVDQTMYSGSFGPTVAGTTYIPINGSKGPQGNRVDAEAKMDRPTSFMNLRVFVVVKVAGTGAVTITLMKGAVATSLSVTLNTSGSNNTWVEDITHQVDVTAGETVSLQIVAAGTFVAFPAVTIATIQRVTS